MQPLTPALEVVSMAHVHMQHMSMVESSTHAHSQTNVASSQLVKNLHVQPLVRPSVLAWGVLLDTLGRPSSPC